jgi:hypothetical protein
MVGCRGAELTRLGRWKRRTYRLKRGLTENTQNRSEREIASARSGLPRHREIHWDHLVARPSDPCNGPMADRHRTGKLLASTARDRPRLRLKIRAPSWLATAKSSLKNDEADDPSLD